MQSLPVAVWVLVEVRVTICVWVLVDVWVLVEVWVLVALWVLDAVRVLVEVCVLVAVYVLVEVRVPVPVWVSVLVWPPLFVAVTVSVAGTVTVEVEVRVLVTVEVLVSVSVLVRVEVLVNVAVRVGVKVLVTVTVSAEVCVWMPVCVPVAAVQVLMGTAQTLASWGQSVSAEQMVTPSFWQRAWRQSSSDWQIFPEATQAPRTPPRRQLLPLSQSTPASLLLLKLPPGTPVIEPEVSSTMSMLPLWSCRSMTTRGFTRACETGGQKQANPSATARKAKAKP